eukprot:4948468-Pleurochrysis_carterae.AAC.2
MLVLPSPSSIATLLLEAPGLRNVEDIGFTAAFAALRGAETTAEVAFFKVCLALLPVFLPDAWPMGEGMVSPAIAAASRGGGRGCGGVHVLPSAALSLFVDKLSKPSEVGTSVRQRGMAACSLDLADFPSTGVLPTSTNAELRHKHSLACNNVTAETCCL